MNSRSAAALATFALAVGVNTGGVYAQARWRWLTRVLGRADWYGHLAIILPPWLLFFVVLERLKPADGPLPLPGLLRAGGRPVELAGALLSLAGIVQLGPAAALGNGYFFGRSGRGKATGGVFRWLRNPIYDGYALLFLGTALRKASLTHLLLATESFLLLNVFEAGVENRPFARD